MNTTVIIPNYNGIGFLRDCIDSLKGSEDKDFKIIVVDDGSTDGSKELIKNEFPDVRLLEHETNRGFASAVNTGIRAADTEFVLLLNNDTVVRKHFVRNMERAIMSDGRVFSASARMLRFDDPDIMDGAGDYYCALGWAFAYGKGKKASKYDNSREIFSSCAGAAIYRREKLLELGLFDERHFAYLEDVDIGYRARLSGLKNVYAPDAEVLHVGSGFSGSRYNEFKVRLSSRNSTYIICKNMPILQQLINLPFFIIGFGIKWLFFCLKGYGGLYLKGIFSGIAYGYSAEGRAHRVRFTADKIGNCFAIQLRLWAGIVLWAGLL